MNKNVNPCGVISKPKTTGKHSMTINKTGNTTINSNNDYRVVKPIQDKQLNTKTEDKQSNVKTEDASTTKNKKDNTAAVAAGAAVGVAAVAAVVGGVKGAIKVIDNILKSANDNRFVYYSTEQDISNNWVDGPDSIYNTLSAEDAEKIRTDIVGKDSVSPSGGSSGGGGVYSDAMANESEEEKKQREKRGYYHIIIDNGHGVNVGGKQGPDLYEWKWNRIFARILRTTLVDLGFNAHITVPGKYEFWKGWNGKWDNIKDATNNAVNLTQRQKLINSIVSKYGPDKCISVSVHLNAGSNNANAFFTKKHRGWTVWTSTGETTCDHLATHMFNVCKEENLKTETQLSLEKVKVDKEQVDSYKDKPGYLVQNDNVYKMYDDKDPDCEKPLALTSGTIKCPRVLTENFFMDAAPDNADLKKLDTIKKLVKVHFLGICRFLDDKKSKMTKVAGRADLNDVKVTPSKERIDKLTSTVSYIPVSPEGVVGTERIVFSSDGEFEKLVSGPSDEYLIK